MFIHDLCFLSSSLILDMKSGQYCGSWGAKESTQEKKDKFYGLVSSLSKAVKGNRLISAPVQCLVWWFFFPKVFVLLLQ